MDARNALYAVVLVVAHVSAQYGLSATSSSPSSSSTSSSLPSTYKSGASFSSGYGSGAFSPSSSMGYGISDGMSAPVGGSSYASDGYRRGVGNFYSSSAPYAASSNPYGGGGFMYGGPSNLGYSLRSSYGPLLDTGSYGVPPGFLSGSGVGTVYRVPSTMQFGYGNGYGSMGPYGSFGPTFSAADLSAFYGPNQYGQGSGFGNFYGSSSDGNGFGAYSDPQTLGGVRTSQIRQKESRTKFGKKR